MDKFKALNPSNSQNIHLESTCLQVGSMLELTAWTQAVFKNNITGIQRLLLQNLRWRFKASRFAGGF